MGEQRKMLTRTALVCLLVGLTYQKEMQKNDTASLQEPNQNPKQQDNLLRRKRWTNLPSRITFRTEIAMTRRMLNEFNGNKRRAEKWVRAKVRDANNAFNHHTLDTKVTIKVMNQRIKIVEENMHYQNQLDQYKARYLGNKYPLGIFGLDKGPSDFHGLANFRRACFQNKCNWPKSSWNCGLGAYMIRDEASITSGRLLAHEIGHVIGMNHNNDAGCGLPKGGVMNPTVVYFDTTTQWTSCNNANFKLYYSKLGGNACL